MNHEFAVRHKDNMDCRRGTRALDLDTSHKSGLWAVPR